MILRLVAWIPILGLLCGCAAVANVTSASRPLDTFELTPASPTAAVVRGTRHLVVETPRTSGALDTERIAVKPNAYQVSYLPGARWSDPAPEHLRLLLARTLAEGGGFALVSTDGSRADPDWFLSTDLQAFQVEVIVDGTARVVVRLSATLISDRDRAIRGTRTFEQTAVAADISAASVVPAFERATSAVLRDVAAWTLATAR